MQLNYWCYMNETGYSSAAQDYLFAMQKMDPSVDIRLHFMNQKIGSGISRNREQMFLAMNKKDPKEDSVHLYHSIPARYRRPPGRQKHFGFCVFETINPPSDWISTMNNMDAIFTASNFNKNVFETSGVKTPIHVVPHCFDPKHFNRSVSTPGRYDQLTFISLGTWKKRKNWEQLIKSWYQAFEARDNVCLLVKTNNPVEMKIATMRIKKTSEWRSKNTAPIYCEENPVCDFEDIPSFLRKGDIYISPSLGEGFGLSGLHAMALGIPVITTRFGGVLEYAKPEFCTYLEPDKYQTIPVMDSIPQLDNCIWPHITIGEIASKMRAVALNVKEREEKAQLAYEYVHSNFTHEIIGKKLLEVLGI